MHDAELSVLVCVAALVVAGRPPPPQPAAARASAAIARTRTPFAAGTETRDIAIDATSTHMRQEPSIRDARPGELELLREIAIAAKSHWGYDPEWVRSWAAGGDFSPEALKRRLILVAEDDGRAVAFALLSPKDEVAWLDDLWVEPEWIGLGVGTRLFEAAVSRARELGAERMEGEAEPNAVGFYEKMGGRYARDSEESELGRILPIMSLEVS